MPTRKGWLTPNAPLPGDTVCRRVLIPNDLQIIAAVNGALLELTKNYNWEQFGSATPDEIASAMLNMYLDYVSEPCGGGGGCRRIYRIGQGGLIEMSDDAGETWQSAATEIPPTPARNEPTEEERLCNAAANVVNVLHQTYEEMIDAWQLDSSVDFGIGAFATVLGLLVGSWLGVVTAAAIPFVWELFGSVYATIGTFLQDAWDSDFTDALTCLFLEAATDTDGVVTFDWSAISQSLADRVAETAAPEDALLWLQLNYMVLFIGVEGLNAAGATTAITDYDCSYCSECVPLDCVDMSDSDEFGIVDGAVDEDFGNPAPSVRGIVIGGLNSGFRTTVDVPNLCGQRIVSVSADFYWQSNLAGNPSGVVARAATLYDANGVVIQQAAENDQIPEPLDVWFNRIFTFTTSIVPAKIRVGFGIISEGGVSMGWIDNICITYADDEG